MASFLQAGIFALTRHFRSACAGGHTCKKQSGHAPRTNGLFETGVWLARWLGFHYNPRLRFFRFHR